MLGVHLSKNNAEDDISFINGDIFQIFLTNPRGYFSPSRVKFVSSYNFVIHLPYLINFASSNSEVVKKSIEYLNGLNSNLNLKNKYSVVHAGQAGKDFDVDVAIKRWIEAFEKIEFFKTKLLIENTAGGQAAPGKNLENLVELVLKLRKKGFNIGVCYDTCHAFASGIENLTDGLLFLKGELGEVELVHFNDSKDNRNSNRDRHQLIGKGTIPQIELKTLYQNAIKINSDIILETPGDRVIWQSEISYIRNNF